MLNTTNHLTSIANRQRGTRVRDALFAACVALAAVVSLTTVAQAAHNAAPVTHVAHR